ncbi:hypothetical protein I8D64_11750 [Brachybacterium sp. MASK1Z-5]|uniref:Antimicrobial peptide, SdpC family n=1 Tax=Brachybacterium halotolerans TaxID=2795215 RepID=A0ABS1BBR4_9MICO|nr:hypothetical protein [Brachybacterium halotolerans]MBK0332073.1 hypothetical protein [Brachybacterium halotolerans]
MINKIATRFAPAALAGSIAIASFGTLPAVAEDQDHPDTPSLSQATSNYSDEEFLKLLLDGSGQIADDHPELVEQLGFSGDKPHADKDALKKIVTDYLEYDPDFRSQIVERLTSGNPLKVEGALKAFTKTFYGLLTDVYGLDTSDTMAPDAVAKSSGKANVKVGLNVAAAANAAVLVNAVVYANAAVATLAVAVIAVVPGAVSYLPDENGEYSDLTLEKKETVSAFTKALNS